MGYFEAAVMGIVQGLTEFLPVSSSAHLILARAVLGWDADQLGLAFDVACHVGTLLAVVAYFRVDLAEMAAAVPGLVRMPAWPAKGAERQLRLVIAGTVPILVVGLLFGSRIEALVRTPTVAAGMLAAGALLFLVVERVGARTRGEASLSVGESLAIGAAQAVALIPGVSRSGATMTVAMFAGLRREAAARFSFLLGVPAIVAAAAHEGIDLARTGLSGAQAAMFVIGMVTSAAVGYLAIRFLLMYLITHTLAVFAWYRLALAAAFAVWLLAGRGV